MSTTIAISTPNLEYYRKQAKALLKAVSANNSAALSRVLLHLPLSDKPLRLADAQWVLAREYGFPSWPKFKSHVESAPPGIMPPEAGPGDSPSATSAPLKSGRGATIGTDAVFVKTGKHWVDWFALLDAAGCATMSHKQIVGVASAHCSGSWWQQMVAVHYERERGLRDTNMSCDGDYNVGVTKTLPASAGEVFDAWTDPSIRDEWLPGARMTVRKAVPGKRILISWADAGSVTVDFYAKPDGRCRCTTEHSKLASSDDVEQYRAFWSAALERLNVALQEKENRPHVTR